MSKGLLNIEGISVSAHEVDEKGEDRVLYDYDSSLEQQDEDDYSEEFDIICGFFEEYDSNTIIKVFRSLSPEYADVEIDNPYIASGIALDVLLEEGYSREKDCIEDKVEELIERMGLEVSRDISLDFSDINISKMFDDFSSLSTNEIIHAIDEDIFIAIENGEEIAYTNIVPNPIIELFRLGTGYVISDASRYNEKQLSIIVTFFDKLRPIQRARMSKKYLFSFTGIDNDKKIVEILKNYYDVPMLSRIFFYYLCGIVIIIGNSNVLYRKVERLFELLSLNS